MSVIIDHNLCTACGQCVDACPFGALSLTDDNLQVNDGCTLCGACLDICPVQALSLPETTPKADSRTAQAKGVWVLAEQRGGVMPDVVAELLGQGRTLARDLQAPLAAVLLGHGVEHLASDLFAWGADTVYLADDQRLAFFNDDIYTWVLNDLIRQYQPEIFLAGATAFGRSLAPRLATAVQTGLTADCTGLTIDPEKKLLRQTRPAFGGNIMATILCPTARPQMATVRPRVMKRAELQAGRQGEIIKSLVNPAYKSATQVLETVVSQEEEVNLGAAEIIVTGGRGLAKAEGFDLVRRLASALGGVVGATRGAVDSGWIAHAHQVGQTGRTVGPKLYVALGVSGAVQHLVGMQSSDVIVAVNNNPDAPIFQVATYGIVGDLYQVAEAMLARLQKLRG